MSTIGVGKAFRDQDRAARQARERRDGFSRSTAAGGLPEVTGTVPCAACGDVLAGGDVMYGASGALCPSCFVAESEAEAEARAPSRWWRRAAQVLQVVGLWVATGFLAVVFTPWVDAPRTMLLRHGGGRNAVGWLVVLVGLGSLCAVLWLQHLRELAGAIRSTTPGTGRSPIVLATLDLVAVTVPVVGLSGLTVWWLVALAGA